MSIMLELVGVVSNVGFVDMRKKLNIMLEKIKDFCEQQNIEPLSAMNNGSRAWGYDSENSDYDLKVLYVHKDKNKYMSLFGYLDNHHLQYDKMHDFAFWDITKFLKLLHKGNAQTYEVLFSDKQYMSVDLIDNYLKNFTYVYLTSDKIKEVAYHYYGLAHKTFKERVRNVGEPTAKKYLYVIRPLMCVDYICEFDRLPPLNFMDCFIQTQHSYPEKIRDQIKYIHKQKCDGNLDRLTKERFPHLDTFLEQKLVDIKSKISTISDIDNGIKDRNKVFDNLFQDFLDK